MMQDDQQLIPVNNIAVDGIICEANGFSDLQLAQTLHKKVRISSLLITCCSDHDIPNYSGWSVPHSTSSGRPGIREEEAGLP